MVKQRLKAKLLRELPAWFYHNKAIRHICKVGYVMFLLQSNTLQLGDSKGLEF